MIGKFNSLECLEQGSGLVPNVQPDAFAVAPEFDCTEELRVEIDDGDMDKRKVWAKVLESRQKKGLPYIFFTDNVNRNKPQVYKDSGAVINASNLCSEIMLPSTADESFICCLSSMNLELYDEWKDTNAVKLAIYFLDAVLSEFIEKTEGNYYLSSARKFALRHRALGLGVLGYHSYLQKNMIPFESMEAKMFNARAFKQIQEQSIQASKELANIYGEPEMLKGYGMRHSRKCGENQI